MAYHFEGEDIVIDGWEDGVGASPYGTLSYTSIGETGGLGDMRNINIISVPKEAAVGFATTSQTLAALTGTVTSADSSADTITYAGAIPDNGTAIVFSGGSLPSGISAGTTYWIFASNGTTFKIAVLPGSSSPVNITSDGTGSYVSTDMGQPQHWAVDANSRYYLIDINGRVWYGTGTIWVFTGNTTLANASGNGLGYYQAKDGTGYLFAYRNNKIDYMPTASLGSWTYAWQTLNQTAAGQNSSHFALNGQDNVQYFCDRAFIGSFFEKAGQTFDPNNSATYTYTETALALPTVEISTWLAELGTSLMVAGVRNLIYPWDRVSTSYSFPLFLPETSTSRMVTVNTTLFLFTGVRGRIYQTNGVQVQLYAKVPDFISGTIDPYFSWGAVGFNKNQIYFGVNVTSNDTTPNTNYGGLWAIDTDTKAMRLVNKLSYGTYAGFASLFIPVTTNGAAGSGFYCGWNSGASTYGVDASSGTAYTNYEPSIDSDMIPVGTILKPKTPTQIEFKLTKPLVSGEGVKIYWRSDLSRDFTATTVNSGLIGETTTAGVISDIYIGNFQNAQWIQLRVNTKSTGSSPSYTRLREIRIR